MKKATLFKLCQMMALIFLCLFATAIYGQKKYIDTDSIIMMDGSNLYGKVSSVTDDKLTLDDGNAKMDFYPSQVYRVYQNSKGKIFAPSYIERGLEKVKNSKPQMFRINKEKSGEIRFAELVQDGEIMVYYFKSSALAVGGGTSGALFGFTTTKYWCALKRSSGQIIELNDVVKDILGHDVKERAKNLSVLIKDEPKLLEQFLLERKYSYKLFLDYIKRYNEIVCANNLNEHTLSESLVY